MKTYTFSCDFEGCDESIKTKSNAVPDDWQTAHQKTASAHDVGTFVHFCPEHARQEKALVEAFERALAAFPVEDQNVRLDIDEETGNFVLELIAQ